MASKTTALSVRVSDDDADFLARLHLEGSTTPSEKLRALLSAQRRLHEGASNPADSAETIQDLLRPALRRLRRTEEELGVHSEAVQRLYDRLPMLAGLALAGPAEADDTARHEALLKFEARMLEHAVLLCEEIINLAMVTEPHAYAPKTVQERLLPVIELAQMTRLAQKQSRGENNG